LYKQLHLPTSPRNVKITYGYKIVEFVINYFINRLAGFFRVAIWLLIGGARQVQNFATLLWVLGSIRPISTIGS
jgi:hypothetical protein